MRDGLWLLRCSVGMWRCLLHLVALLRTYLAPHAQNPNVVGSGFISFPPQQRFEKPLLVQPPTISVSSIRPGGGKVLKVAMKILRFTCLPPFTCP